MGSVVSLLEKNKHKGFFFFACLHIWGFNYYISTYVVYLFLVQDPVVDQKNVNVDRQKEQCWDIPRALLTCP